MHDNSKSSHSITMNELKICGDRKKAKDIDFHSKQACDDENPKINFKRYQKNFNETVQ